MEAIAVSHKRPAEYADDARKKQSDAEERTAQQSSEHHFYDRVSRLTHPALKEGYVNMRSRFSDVPECLLFYELEPRLCPQLPRTVKELAARGVRELLNPVKSRAETATIRTGSDGYLYGEYDGKGIFRCMLRKKQGLSSWVDIQKIPLDPCADTAVKFVDVADNGDIVVVRVHPTETSYIDVLPAGGTAWRRVPLTRDGGNIDEYHRSTYALVGGTLAACTCYIHAIHFYSLETGMPVCPPVAVCEERPNCVLGLHTNRSLNELVLVWQEWSIDGTINCVRVMVTVMSTVTREKLREFPLPEIPHTDYRTQTAIDGHSNIILLLEAIYPHVDIVMLASCDGAMFDWSVFDLRADQVTRKNTFHSITVDVNGTIVISGGGFSGGLRIID
jgi:hypothetical protein